MIFLKEIGLGALVAVLVDAFVVRSTLVPSLMALLGEWNWWSPPWLRRVHERIGLGESWAVPPRALTEPRGQGPVGGVIRDVTEASPLARDIRWPSVGLLAAFLLAGAFTRHPRDLPLSLAAIAVAIAAAIHSPRLRPASGAWTSGSRRSRGRPRRRPRGRLPGLVRVVRAGILRDARRRSETRPAVRAGGRVGARCYICCRRRSTWAGCPGSRASPCRPWPPP